MTKGQCQSSWSKSEYFVAVILFLGLNLKQGSSWLEWWSKIYTAVICNKQLNAFVEAEFAYVRI